MKVPTKEEREATIAHYAKFGLTEEEVNANMRVAILDEEASEAFGAIMLRLCLAGAREEDVVLSVRALYKLRAAAEREAERVVAEEDPGA